MAGDYLFAEQGLIIGTDDFTMDCCASKFVLGFYK